MLFPPAILIPIAFVFYLKYLWILTPSPSIQRGPREVQKSFVFVRPFLRGFSSPVFQAGRAYTWFFAPEKAALLATATFRSTAAVPFGWTSDESIFSTSLAISYARLASPFESKTPMYRLLPL